MQANELEPRFEEAATRFKRYLRATGGAKGKVNTDVTVRTYIQQLRLFWAFCSQFECTPLDADFRVIERWFDKRKDVSSASQIKDRASLRHFYAMLRRDGYRTDDPTVGINIKREESLPTKPQTGDELEALLEACFHERDRLMILVLSSTSMRVAELSAMDTADVDWKLGTITVHGKGRKERQAQVPPEILKRLRLHVGMIDPDGQPVRTGPIWRGLHYPHRAQSTKEIGRTLAKIGKRAGVEVHPHRLRATFAKEFMREHHDLHELQRLMGHADANTTVRYLHWVTDELALEHQAGLKFSDRLVKAAWPSSPALDTLPPSKPRLLSRLVAAFRG